MKFIISWTALNLILLLYVLTPLYYSEPVQSGQYTIRFDNKTDIEIALSASGNWGGYTTYHNDIHILKGLTRLDAVGVCWHEKMHNVIRRRMNWTGIDKIEKEHWIMKQMGTNYFDPDCLFMYSAV